MDKLKKVGLLLAPSSFWKAHQRTRDKRCNGCGTSGWKGKLVPDTIVGCCVTPACNIHDWMYHEGGLEADKVNADKLFRKNMIDIIMASSRWALIKYFGRQRVWLYYRVVKAMGGLYFKYKNLPD